MVNFSTAMQQLNTVFLVVVGTYLIHAENEASRITMGALIASVILSGRALAPLSQIAGLATRFQQARLALKGLDSIIERPTERDPERKYITLSSVQGHIQFNQAAFQYSEQGNEIVSGLNLQINRARKSVS
ncbi:cysteine/glutathione ABC transporter membrane /ATP-binding protein [Actinobacillus equuli]|nr:cysteine/glutathione ABC transporter membrane /ATP-binding protein [Actinobacillus equuli]